MNFVSVVFSLNVTTIHNIKNPGVSAGIVFLKVSFEESPLG